MAHWLFDAGHGGTDPGAELGSRKESHDVLRMTEKVKSIMEFNGQSVDMTRTNDTFVSLEARTNMENAGSYNYFVSFHRNAYIPEKAHGVETYSFSTVGKGRELAEKVQGKLVPIFKTNRGCKTANYWVLKHTRCSAILIEMGFIDHSYDNAIFDKQFDEIAIAIATGLLEQIGVTIKLPSAAECSNCSTEGKTKYIRVVTGSYGTQAGADERVKELKAAGFDSFTVPFYK